MKTNDPMIGTFYAAAREQVVAAPKLFIAIMQTRLILQGSRVSFSKQHYYVVMHEWMRMWRPEGFE